MHECAICNQLTFSTFLSDILSSQNYALQFGTGFGIKVVCSTVAEFVGLALLLAQWWVSLAAVADESSTQNSYQATRSFRLNLQPFSPSGLGCEFMNIMCNVCMVIEHYVYEITTTKHDKTDSVVNWSELQLHVPTRSQPGSFLHQKAQIAI